LDTLALWRALHQGVDSSEPWRKPIINSREAIVESVLSIIGMSSRGDIPPILRVTGSAGSSIIDRYTALRN
jgi:hypothetical protein